MKNLAQINLFFAALQLVMTGMYLERGWYLGGAVVCLLGLLSLWAAYAAMLTAVGNLTLKELREVLGRPLHEKDPA